MQDFANIVNKRAELQQRGDALSSKIIGNRGGGVKVPALIGFILAVCNAVVGKQLKQCARSRRYE